MYKEKKDFEVLVFKDENRVNKNLPCYYCQYEGQVLPFKYFSSSEDAFMDLLDKLEKVFTVSGFVSKTEPISEG